MKRAYTKRGTRKVTIRLSRDLVEELITEGEERGVTVTQIVREVLEERLLRGIKLEETRLIVRELRDEVKRFRREFALSTEVLLSYGGKTPAEEAREWVSRTLGREA